MTEPGVRALPKALDGSWPRTASPHDSHTKENALSAPSTNLMRRTLTLAAGLSVVLAPAALAAAPHPTIGSAVVDGDVSEWQSSDFFADMIRDGGATSTKDTPKQGELYARYDCKTGTLYLHMRTIDKMDLAPQAYLGDHFVRLGGETLVDGLSPNFHFVDHDTNGVPDGWEASAQVAPGSYDDLQVVTKIREYDKDTGHNLSVPGWKVPLQVACEDPKEPTDPPPTPPSPPSTPQPETEPTPPSSSQVKSSTTAPRRAVLRASKTGPRRALSGRTVTYRLRLTNRSNVVARRVVLRDLLPPGMVLAKRPAGAAVRGRLVQWKVGNLGPRRTVVRTIRVRILATTSGRRCNLMQGRARNARTVRNRACTVVKRVKTGVLPAVTG